MFVTMILAVSVGFICITIYCLNHKGGEAEEPVRWLFVSEFNLKIAKGDYGKVK
mgnify:CR=1 FL=1